MDHISPDEQSTNDKSKSSRNKKFVILAILFSLILVALIVFLSYMITVFVSEKRKASKNTTYVQPSTQVDVRPDNRTHQELPVNQLEKKPEPTIENNDNKNTEEETPNPEKLNKNEVLKTDETKDLNTDELNKKENEHEDVVEPPNPPVSTPVTDKVIEEEPKKTEDNIDVIVSPRGEEKKPDVVHPDESPKKVKPSPKPVKSPQKVDVESPETYDVPENVDELRKKYAERMEEQKRKLKEEEEFKKELDRLFKIRQERAMEEARRIKEQKGGKKNPEGVKDTDNVVPAGTDKDTIFKKLEQFAQKLKHTVIKGSFETCLIGKCEKLKVDFVYQWELEIVSEVLSETKTSIDLEKEYKTVGEYREFTKRYGKYMSTKQMFKNAFENYRKNIVKVEKHNKDPNRLYNMEINGLADMGSDLSQLSSFPLRSKERLSGASKNIRNLRSQEIDVDWRKKGVVSEIIHQGACGSCWAIAAVDVFNSHTAIKNRDKTKYSYQQLVDCVSPKYNCDRGGSQLKGLEYIRDNKMCKDEEYKYKGVKNQCSAYKCEKESGFKEIVSLKDKNALEFLKKNGPFLTLFYTTNDFFLYGDGIFNGSCEAKEAHSVVVVGHGLDTEKNKKYWIVKNSWGEDWGEEGYFRILDESTSDFGKKTEFCDFLKYSRGIL